MIKYLLCPGDVSNMFSQSVYVDQFKLASLYGVDVSECMVSPSGGSSNPRGLICLHPMQGGDDYVIPTETEAESLNRIRLGFRDGLDRLGSVSAAFIESFNALGNEIAEITDLMIEARQKIDQSRETLNSTTTPTDSSTDQGER